MHKKYFIILALVLFAGFGCTATPAPAPEYTSPEKQQMMDAKEKSDQVGGYPEAIPGSE